MFRAEAFAILDDDLGQLSDCGHGWFARRRMRRVVTQFLDDLSRLADGDLHRFEPPDIERVRLTIDRGVESIEQWLSKGQGRARRAGPLASAIYRIRTLEEDIYERWRLQTAGHVAPDASGTARPPVS